MKILIAPDSFKGTISAEKAVKVITHAAKRAFGDCGFINMPLADGGRGHGSPCNVVSGRTF